MKKSLNIILPILILLFTTALVTYLMKTKAASPALEITERVWQVNAQSIQSGTYSPSIILYGKVESPRLYNASAPLLSRVESVLIREGEQFKKGQLLAKLDERDFLPQLQIATAKLAEIKAQIRSEQIKYQSDKQALKHEEKLLQLGQQALQRSLKIRKQNLASQSEADDAQKLVEQQRLSLNSRKLNLSGYQARIDKLKATQSQLQAELQKAELALERASFLAPYNGVVAEVNVAAGDQLAIGGTLFSIYPLQDLEIRAKIPASIKDEVVQDLRMGKILQAYINVDGENIRLVLERLSGQATTSGIDALFSVTDASEKLRLGAIYELNFTRSEQSNLYAIPYRAIYGVDKLYKVHTDEKQDKRMQAVRVEKVGNYIDPNKTKKNAREDSFLLIRSLDLSDGELVITSHLPNALNGLKVNVKMVVE